MSKVLDVNYENSFSYHIFLEKSFDALKSAVSELDVCERRALIITDTNIAPLYLREVKAVLAECFSSVSEVILTPGEQYKNTDSIAQIYEKAIQENFDRNDYFIALGGGVVGDMTGFAAATYMRGIKFIQIPTTLLAQVDSSIGGKTGVDFRAYKNMVGAFHMPSLVYSNVSTLTTLDDIQYASGMGEVIKHALIRNRDYFDYLTEHVEELKDRDLSVLQETVYQSNLIKRAVVEIDPKEKGERQLLNFGHTLGHAIEKCSEFSYSHGQCVAFGCIAAMFISGTVTEEEEHSVRKLMEAVGLETVLRKMDHRDILLATRKDKKMDKGHVRFILLHSVGDAFISHEVSDEQMLSALQYIERGFALN
ncbi:3-dehydroquinate synthase [Oribacterium sp. WCC10]|uniref:3-dehydroquinate synthase n=1 Tax=Oribacterium sp. WCC10 TaxID=1855343 RepID=UPI0008F33054|nr:3-dehydroquinate synthase [Oribacterium sp. WCC10]SFG08404.1 3-dehydroquinate synthase [Oribacterium sp. WCC10]